MPHDQNVRSIPHELHKGIRFDTGTDTGIAVDFAALATEEQVFFPVFDEHLIAASPQSQVHSRFCVCHGILQRAAANADTHAEGHRNVFPYGDFLDLVKWLEFLFFQPLQTALREQKNIAVFLQFFDNGVCRLRQLIELSVNKRGKDGQSVFVDAVQHIVVVIQQDHTHNGFLFLQFFFKLTGFGDVHHNEGQNCPHSAAFVHHIAVVQGGFVRTVAYGNSLRFSGAAGFPQHFNDGFCVLTIGEHCRERLIIHHDPATNIQHSVRNGQILGNGEIFPKHCRIQKAVFLWLFLRLIGKEVFEHGAQETACHNPHQCPYAKAYIQHQAKDHHQHSHCHADHQPSFRSFLCFFFSFFHIAASKLFGFFKSLSVTVYVSSSSCKTVSRSLFHADTSSCTNAAFRVIAAFLLSPS